MSDAIDWQAMSAKLSAPFDPADVDFRPQGKPSGNGNVQVVAYVDARTVMARLDDACGPGGWNFTWEPVVVERGQVQIAKGRLTIHGVVREDVGEASNFDPSKGCISDLLKRCAVHFGVARYLYDIERTWVKVSGDRLDERTVENLRAKLPRAGYPGVAPVPAEMEQAARQAAAATAETKEPFRTATPTQWDTIRRGCAALGKEPPEPPMSFEAAGALIGQLSEEYKQHAREQQKTGVTR